MSAATVHSSACRKTENLHAVTTDPQRFSGKWKMKRLGEIVSIRNEKVLPSNVDPDTLCIELDHIGQGDGRLLRWSTAQHSTSSKYRFVIGDILFGRLRSYLRKFWYADRCGICTTEIWPLMVNAMLVDSGFLYAIVQSDRFIEAAGISYGTHMPRADWNVMQAVAIRLPELSEQRAIAEALLDVDGLLAVLETLIAKKRVIKQATMQQLFTGKTRLPGFSGKWEITSMGSIGSIYGGLSGKRKVDFGVGGALYVTFMGIMNNIVIDVNHTDHVHVASGESQNLVLKGDLLFNGTSETPAELAMGAVMGEHIDNLYLNSFCFGFRLHDEKRYVPLFLAYFFRGLAGRAIVNALSQGATRYNISKRQFIALELSVPAFEEQQAIATILSDMDAEISALEQRRDKTRAIKQSMMQALLTGRVRLIKPNPTTKGSTC